METENSNSEIDALLKGIDTLVSLPEIAMRVNQIADDPHSTAEDMGKVVAQDPALSVRMLKIANSPIYGLRKEIDTITRAVALLGLDEIRNLVLTTTVGKAFDGISNNLITMHDFWHHSLYCGLLAQILAKKAGLKTSDTLFVAGLLHDIGQLVMFNRAPEKSSQAILMLTDTVADMDMHESERRVFGFDHMQVGARLIHNWHLSPLLEECVAYHHEPTRAKQFPKEVAVVHIANAVAVMAEFDSTDDDYEVPHIDPHAWEITGLNQEILAAVIKDAQEEIAEVESTLFEKT
jgi:putative nucleotidyltransferase with HDIG domain